MKIGFLLINNNPLYRGGVNSFLNGFLSGLKEEDKTNKYYLLVCDSDAQYYQKYLSKSFHIVKFSDKNKPTLGFRYFLLNIMTAPFLRNFYYIFESFLYSELRGQINSLNLDVIYSPSMPFFPLHLKGKMIISPHDIQHLHFPHYFSVFEKWTRATVFQPSMHLSNVVQASTNFMKKDFNKMMGVPLRKITVIPEGVMDIFLKFKPNKYRNKFFLRKYRLKPNYLFYPAQHWPHKNHITLLKAVMYLKKKYALDIKVVLTGEKKPKFNFLYEFITNNNLDNVVQFLGNIEFSELFYAYNNALMVVVPVSYESSSLPIKEAMALGKPVIASGNGANEEINLNNNIVLFDTYDYKNLAKKIRTLIQDEKVRKELVKKSKEIIKLYSWKKIARRYVDIFSKEISKESSLELRNLNKKNTSIFKNPKWYMNFDKLYRGKDPWGASKQGYRLKLASRFLTGNERKVLDIGCGDGKLFDYCPPGPKLVGIDVSKVAIKLAKLRRPNISFKIADVRYLPFPDNYFDFAFCLEVLYYLPDDTKAFDEIKRVVRRRGRALIGLTLGFPYYDYSEITEKIKTKFTILKEGFILPKPFPQFLNRWGRFGLNFYKLLPLGMRLKVYVLVEKR
jgi:glycosyltransferase involved in cell wall biosynthesis